MNWICFLSEIRLKLLFIVLLLGQYEMIDKPRTNWELEVVLLPRCVDGASGKMKFGDYPEILKKKYVGNQVM